MRTFLPLALSLLTALPANAAPPAAPDDRPWGRGTLMPRFGLGGSLLLDRPGATVQVAGALDYYVLDHLAVGLSLRNLSRIFGSELESAYPGLRSQVATNELGVTPSLTVMPYRGKIVTPLLGLGVGPLVLNNRLGVIGEVVVTPAMLLRVHPRVALDLGFEVSFRFPRAGTRGTYQDPSIDYTVHFPNRLHVGFRVGVAFGPKVGRHRRADPAPPSAAPTRRRPAPRRGPHHRPARTHWMPPRSRRRCHPRRPPRPRPSSRRTAGDC